MTSFPPEGSAVERRNPVEGRSGGVEPLQPVSGELRASLVAVILGLSGDLWHLPTRTDATVMADAILADGWRRVSVDDDTVERVARTLAEVDGYVWDVSEGAADNVANPDYYLRRARAAVQALRDGGEA